MNDWNFAGETIATALGETEGCELHLENTAGAGGTLGRSFDELAALLDAAVDSRRLGVCLDSCHLLASGYDIRTPDRMTAVLRECTRKLGRGDGYLYPHDDPAGFEVDCLPDELQGREAYAAARASCRVH